MPLRLGDLRVAVDKTVKSNVGSYQILLYKVYHILKDVGLEPGDRAGAGLKWSDVKDALRQQGVELTSQVPYEGEAYYHIYTFAKNIEVVGTSFPQSLYVQFVIDNKKGTVERAEPHLSCHIGKPFNAPEVQSGYELNSVVGALFKVDSVIDQTAKYPLLASVDVAYIPLVDRWANLGPMGFYLTIERLGTSKDGESLTGSFSYSAGSGLDPVQDGDGKRVDNEDFTPVDKLFSELGEGYSDPATLAGGKPSIFSERGGATGVGPKPAK